MEIIYSDNVGEIIYTDKMCGLGYLECECCGRNIGLSSGNRGLSSGNRGLSSGNRGLSSGNRGLCDGCEEDIPSYIPKEQYITYMKELWIKK